MRRIGERAIVIGASMAGLLAARVLADYYDEIVILERDQCPAEAGARKGVPQGRHSHVLLARGAELIEQFFPNLTSELTAAGAILAQPGQLRFCARGGYLQTGGLDLPFLLASRPLLEHHVRRRVLEVANVGTERADVVGLVTDAGGARVVGVRAIRRREGSAVEMLAGDLVVDASGRGSRAPAWLERLGYPKPDEEQMRVGIGYTTRLYRRRPDHLEGDAMVVSTTAPPHWRFGVLLAQEHDVWTVSAGGYLGDHAPTTEAGFLEFVRLLAAPEIHHVIKDAEPLSELMAYKFPASLRRRYDKLRAFPEGYLAVGDAVCSFNPVYAQGMTVAALEAETLRRCLSRGPERLARRFFAGTSGVIDASWRLAVGDDLRNPSVEGPRTRAGRLLNWYLDRLLVAAQVDPSVASAFLKVVGMQAPPPSLLRPLTAARVFADVRRRRKPTPSPGDGRRRIEEVRDALS